MNESGGRFDLSAGALCLDFANTWEDRARPATEKIERYADVVAFSAQAAVLDRITAARLRRRAAADQPAAHAALEQAKQLRESIYRVFSAQAAERPVQQADIDRVNRSLGTCTPYRRLALRDEGFALGWCGLDDALLAPLGPIALATAELLISSELDRVRECGSDDCDWLFVDRSRNRSRRWCSMETCGNRSKARRHYDRRKGR